MLPLAAAAAKTIGGAVGGAGQYNDTQKGMTAYRNLANQGVSSLEQGKKGANAAFDPYSSAGKTGLQGQTGAAQGYLGAVNPEAYKSTAGGVNDWLNPSAAYSTDQANRAMQASALAKGGMGGGLAKALANNAQKMAMTNWNNAAQQQLQANSQNFAQNKGTLDSNMANWSNLAQQGLQATGQNQQLQAGYNSGINNNLLEQAAAMQSGWNAKGKVFNDTSKDMGDNIFGGITDIFG